MPSLPSSLLFPRFRIRKSKSHSSLSEALSVVLTCHTINTPLTIPIISKSSDRSTRSPSTWSDLLSGTGTNSHVPSSTSLMCSHHTVQLCSHYIDLSVLIT
ncbi:hypothetical protein SISNIDRAFT_160585 [Sistotremastrum niveocremeum HHB9708]|uniref:Uncharacterized protein n=2 Tax=Sistotremastraceae TaxID=3402574 RepID=A0A164SX86_9AGAM|nr:hypothetical protein SISNIDRAFT_160585 [Sistotremastrum niveocremeum HHB9708]KZT40321.1 hypothetical protein SISSUDRAFT_525146 [Sistotremastrum suecicum HHB10207 ss-3]